MQGGREGGRAEDLQGDEEEVDDPQRNHEDGRDEVGYACAANFGAKDHASSVDEAEGDKRQIRAREKESTGEGYG